MLDGPVHGPSKHVIVVVVHPEDEAAVDHDPQAMEPIGHGRIVAAQVLALVATDEIAGREGFEPDEEAAKAGGCGSLDQIAAKHGVDGRRSLEKPVHPAHPVEQRAAEALIAEQMIVEEIEMPPGQARDFRERVINTLRVERAAAGEEGILVAEVAVLRAPARDHDGVRHQIAATVDQIAAHRRQTVQRPPRRRPVDLLRAAGAKVREKLGERLLRRAQKYRVGVRRGLIGQRGHVQSPDRHECAPGAIVVGDAIGAIGVRDVRLDQHEIRAVVEVELLHVLVHEHRLIVRVEKRGQGCEAERRKQRVLDWTPVGAGRLREGGENQLDSKTAHTL